MNRYSVLLLPILLFAGGRVMAQTTHGKEKPADEVKQENVKKTASSEEKSPTTIKVVPQARARNAKPAKVSPAKARTARPGGTRPARNPRPSARPPRPGNGRN